MDQELEVARRWWALESGSVLPLTHGDVWSLLFSGRLGGPAGPDVRDAVLLVGGEHGRELVGDVEFHVRASDWVTHQHHSDPRYNAVILHIVMLCDDPQPTRRQDGTTIPTCSLNDLPPLPLPTQDKAVWPCHVVMQQLSDEERFNLLKRAGLLRFEQKTHAFVERLHAEGNHDLCLIPALAEGLGYGRDRDFFRAAGRYLLGQAQGLPEPLGRAVQPSPLDVGRLRVLHSLIEQSPGIWQKLRDALSTSQEITTNLHILRTLFCALGLSLARTDILICNVVLPFAAAVALIEHDAPLMQRVQELYMMHPGLPSNSITRSMSTQLQLKTEPRGSCQQQGLHYIQQQTCREKHCTICIVGRNIL